ncbi:MAG TPA: lysylphosphatidylglycerol synthase domain-containing protein, partial [Nocardioidaceae bacterium]
HAGLPAEATGARPGPISVFLKVASGVLSGALIVLLFMAIIPKVTEYQSVGDSLKSMSPLTIALLFVMAVLIRLVLAASYDAVMPGLSLWRSLVAREASSAVSNVIPGPSGTAAQWAILRSWDVTTERFAQATLAVSVSTDVLILAGPGAFFVLWALSGMPDSPDGGNAWAFGLGAVILSVLSVVVVAGVAKSMKLAGRLGRLCQACVNPLRRVISKPRITDLPEKFVVLRADMIEVLRLYGRMLLSWVVSGYLLNGVLLVACLWACGASRNELPMSLGLMLYAVGRIATIIQITPGGVGVVEIAYTSVYVAVLGESAQPAIVAGVLVYRMFTYLLPIITGAFAYVVWRVMRRSELHHEAAAESA